MGLSKIWVRTLRDGLIRADQIIGVSTHTTPSFAEKPGHWLLDVTIGAASGSGADNQWELTILHRTLVQAPSEPRGAAEALAQLLSALQETDEAGIVTPIAAGRTDGRQPFSAVRFSFAPFPATSVDSSLSTSSADHVETAPGVE